jgi:hypothetical protein
MAKIHFYFFSVCTALLLSSCEFGPDGPYPPYGTYLPGYCTTDPNKQCLTVDLGKLDDPTQYRVVMTTHEYPDNAPPFAGATQIIPLTEDYTFYKPIPNAQRDPLLLQPNQFNVVIELKAIKVKPASPLYFYLVQVSGNGFVPSGKLHITAIAEPYKN